MQSRAYEETVKKGFKLGLTEKKLKASLPYLSKALE